MLIALLCGEALKIQRIHDLTKTSRTDPDLVTLDGVTNGKTEFLATRSDLDDRARADAGERMHTHRFLEPLCTLRTKISTLVLECISNHSSGRYYFETQLTHAFRTQN